MALMDGELTEKEKQILFKKAEKFGVDLDEFEMVLDAKLYEKTKSVNQEKQITSAPKSDKFGDVKKCPSCGAIVQSLQTICSDCGHEFRNIDSVNSIRDFFRDYQKIEDSVVVNKAGGFLGMLVDESEGNRLKQVFTKKKEFIMHWLRK